MLKYNYSKEIRSFYNLFQLIRFFFINFYGLMYDIQHTCIINLLFVICIFTMMSWFVGEYIQKMMQYDTKSNALKLCD